MGLLSLLIGIPFIGALAIALTPNQARSIHRALGLVVSLVCLGLSFVMVSQFNTSDFHFQLTEQVKWLPQLGISYFVGVDGISLWMVVLTALLSVIGCFFSVYEDGKRSKAFYALMLVLLGSMIGTFLSLDLILFYTFFELSLLPVALMIWIWGNEDKKRAAMRYFVYLFGGSILMLVGMVMIAYRLQATNGMISFNLVQIQAAAANGSLWQGSGLILEPFLFWVFALAFLIKSPVFPFHTWMVDSYTQAPIGAVLLGVLVKTGTFGLVRFCLPLFPDVASHASSIILTLAVIGILYGATLAAVQTDIKKVIAYSSVSHVGFIVLGIFSMNQNGLVGGILGGFYHGIASGMLILLVHLICVRMRTRSASAFGGLKAQMPVFATLFLVALVAAIGLPGTNGFISEFLSLIGAYEGGFSHHLSSVSFAVIATSGVILAVVYMLLLFQKLFYGKTPNSSVRYLKDLKSWETIGLAVLAILLFWGGLAPSTFTEAIDRSADATRLMTINGPEMRPSWMDKSESIGPDGGLYSEKEGATILLSKAKYHGDASEDNTPYQLTTPAQISGAGRAQ